MVVDLKIPVVVLLISSIIACSGDASNHNRSIRTASGRYQSHPSEPLTARWHYSDNPQSIQWTNLTYAAIEKYGRNLIKIKPTDVDDFCPQYDDFSLEMKKQFWVFLISAISELESMHNPDVIYKEQFKDKYGKYIISRGLLQLSRESVLGYGCEFSSEKDLHDPELNLTCGVQILNQWVGRDQRITGKLKGSWQGGARYWSTLRDVQKVRQIKVWINETCMCKKF